MAKFVVLKSLSEVPEVPVSRAKMSWNKTGSWRSSTPDFGGKIPPCNFSCPAGEDIRGYLALVNEKKTAEAFELLTSANPLPAVCGRVCYHPCQTDCNRKQFDTELQIREIEKQIGDWGRSHDQQAMLPEPGSFRVAVVGSGPAGLAAAYYLRRRGVNIDLYDRNNLPGGILQYGIPSYRLPKEVLQAELKRVMNGVNFKPNRTLGVDLRIDDLATYDAVFIATGAHRSKPLGINGEDHAAVQSGLEFLHQVNSGKSIDLSGKKIIVIGGGNTACDVARSAYRLGGKVSMVYRRTEAEMPAFAEEIKELKQEPIELIFLASPIKIEASNDDQVTVTFQRMELGPPDDTGRSRPIPVAGSQLDLSADTLFSAIGEDPDLTFFPEVNDAHDGGFDFSQIDERIRSKLFVGGDILPNPRTVPHAVGSGRLAAEKIYAFLSGEEIQAAPIVAEVAGPENINYAYYNKIKTVIADSSVDAAEEAGRCFSCGVCTACDNCYNFCPDLAVIKSADGYQANLDFCKGCGICAAECPCGSIGMKGGGAA